eukprot:1147747-Pelagomonas_calceolata.AAC.3
MKILLALCFALPSLLQDIDISCLAMFSFSCGPASTNALTFAQTQEGGSANGVSAAPGGQQQLSVNNNLWPGLPTDGLQTLCTAADVVSSPEYVEWLPSFGCAVLALGKLPPTRGDDSAAFREAIVVYRGLFLDPYGAQCL